MKLTSEIIITLQNLKGVGKKTILKIAENIYNPISTIDDLCLFWTNQCRLSTNTKSNFYNKYTHDDLIAANKIAKNIIKKNEFENIGIISYYETNFPSILKYYINEFGKDDPVILLYYKGNLNLLEKPGIAIIGTREPTKNGLKAGRFFAEEFAKENFNIVSGLAIGCDTAGHKGALNINGATTAFLANGLDWDSIYPKENLELAKSIVKNGGLLLSEYPIGQPCGRYSLVARDRLQASLSFATIAIQTNINGGTMHAVNTTLKQGKPLFMVEYKNPEDITHEKVQGNIKLINEGKAHPLSSDNIKDALAMIDVIIDKYNSSRKMIQPNLFSNT